MGMIGIQSTETKKILIGSTEELAHEVVVLAPIKAIHCHSELELLPDERLRVLKEGILNNSILTKSEPSTDTYDIGAMDF